MKKAQTAMEYMILIAAILVVSGVVILIVTGSVGTQVSQISSASCKEAAANCRILHFANPSDPCNRCTEACQDPTTSKDIFTGAVQCCKAGKPDSIYDGATACVYTVCGNDKKEGEEDCDGTDATACAGFCQSDCTCPKADYVPPVITNVQHSTPTYSTVTVNWITDEPSSTKLYYSTDTLFSQTMEGATNVYSHVISLTGLSEFTLYNYKVQSCDSSGNCANSTSYSFTTSSTPDTTPPFITAGPTAAPGYQFCDITWSTNEQSTTKVLYSTDTSYSLTGTGDIATSHFAKISSLIPATTYFYKVQSCDGSNNCVTSTSGTFTTASQADTYPPSQVTGLTAPEIYSNVIGLSWTASTDTGGGYVAYYRVYRSTASAGPYTKISTDGNVTTTKYYDYSVASASYYYKVSAVDSYNNEGLNSTVLNANNIGQPASPPIADAGPDQSGPASVSNFLSGSCSDVSGYSAVTESQVLNTANLIAYGSCGTIKYASVHYEDGDGGANSGAGVFFRRLTGVPTGVSLDVIVDVSAYSHYVVLFSSSVYVSTVSSTNLGDGNWVQCGAGFSSASEGNYAYSQSCSNVVSSTGDLYIAYTQGITRKYSSEDGHAILKTLNVTYKFGTQLKGEGVPGGGGATSIAKYEWDFDANGAYDWVSDSAHLVSKYSKQLNLSGSCSDFSAYPAVSESQVLSTANLIAYGSCGTKKYASVHYEDSDEGTNSGTGVFFRRLMGVPTGIPLNITINVAAYSHYVVLFSSSVYVSTVSSTNLGDGNWVPCGTGFSSTSEGTYAYSKICNNVISTTGTIYVAYTQGITRKYSSEDGHAILRILNVQYQSAPGIYGWTYYSFPTGVRNPVLRVTDNAATPGTDTDTAVITVQ